MYYPSSFPTSKLPKNIICNISYPIFLSEPMEDGDVGGEANEDYVYCGPNQGQAVRNHITQTYFS